MGVSIDDARAIAAPLPRSYEALVRDRVQVPCRQHGVRRVLPR